MIRQTKILRAGVAAVLSGLMVIEPALVSAAESNFWADRRRAVAGPRSAVEAKPGKDTSYLLASLPTIANPVTAGAGLKNAAGLARLDLIGKVPNWIQSAVTPFATIQTARLKAGASRPTVVLVQDAHLHNEAQRHIGGVVEALGRQALAQGGRLLVGLEGAKAGVIDLNAYRTDTPEIMKEVAWGLSSVSLLSGAEAAAIATAGKPNGGSSLIELVGAEDWNLYNANVAALRQSVPFEKPAKAALADLRRELVDVKRKHFDANLIRFDARKETYEDGSLSLPNYALYLDSIVTATGRNLRELIEAALIEGSLKFDRVESERKRLLSELVPKLSDGEIKDLLQASVAFRAGQVTYSAYYENIKALASRKGLPLSKFPEMNIYIQYVLKSEAIDHRKLFEEIRSLESAVEKRLASTDQQRAVLSLVSDSHLLKKLIDRALIESEWHAYEARRADIAHLLGRLAQVGGGKPQTLVDMEPRWAAFESFYTAALARNHAMADNLASAIESSAAKQAVLVAGGFHAEGLAALLEEKNFNVLVLSPKITKLNDGPSSLEFLAAGRLPLDEIFVGKKLFLPTEMAMGKPLTAPLVNVVEDVVEAGVAAGTAERRVTVDGTEVVAAFNRDESGGKESEDGVEFGAKGGTVRLTAKQIEKARAAPWKEKWAHLLPILFVLLWHKNGPSEARDWSYNVRVWSYNVSLRLIGQLFILLGFFSLPLLALTSALVFGLPVDAAPAWATAAVGLLSLVPGFFIAIGVHKVWNWGHEWHPDRIPALTMGLGFVGGESATVAPRIPPAVDAPVPPREFKPSNRKFDVGGLRRAIELLNRTGWSGLGSYQRAAVIGGGLALLIGFAVAAPYTAMGVLGASVFVVARSFFLSKPNGLSPTRRLNAERRASAYALLASAVASGFFWAILGAGVGAAVTGAVAIVFTAAATDYLPSFLRARTATAFADQPAVPAATEVVATPETAPATAPEPNEDSQPSQAASGALMSGAALLAIVAGLFVTFVAGMSTFWFLSGRGLLIDIGLVLGVLVAFLVLINNMSARPKSAPESMPVDSASRPSEEKSPASADKPAKAASVPDSYIAPPAPVALEPASASSVTVSAGALRPLLYVVVLSALVLLAPIGVGLLFLFPSKVTILLLPILVLVAAGAGGVLHELKVERSKARLWLVGAYVFPFASLVFISIGLFIAPAMGLAGVGSFFVLAGGIMLASFIASLSVGLVSYRKEAAAKAVLAISTARDQALSDLRAMNAALAMMLGSIAAGKRILRESDPSKKKVLMQTYYKARFAQAVGTMDEVGGDMAATLYAHAENAGMSRAELADLLTALIQTARQAAHDAAAEAIPDGLGYSQKAVAALRQRAADLLVDRFLGAGEANESGGVYSLGSLCDVALGHDALLTLLGRSSPSSNPEKPASPQAAAKSETDSTAEPQTPAAPPAETVVDGPGKQTAVAGDDSKAAKGPESVSTPASKGSRTEATNGAGEAAPTKRPAASQGTAAPKTQPSSGSQGRTASSLDDLLKDSKMTDTAATKLLGELNIVLPKRSDHTSDTGLAGTRAEQVSLTLQACNRFDEGLPNALWSNTTLMGDPSVREILAQQRKLIELILGRSPFGPEQMIAALKAMENAATALGGRPEFKDAKGLLESLLKAIVEESGNLEKLKTPAAPATQGRAASPATTAGRADKGASAPATQGGPAKADPAPATSQPAAAAGPATVKPVPSDEAPPTPAAPASPDSAAPSGNVGADTAPQGPVTPAPLPANDPAASAAVAADFDEAAYFDNEDDIPSIIVDLAIRHFLKVGGDENFRSWLGVLIGDLRKIQATEPLKKVIAATTEALKRLSSETSPIHRDSVLAAILPLLAATDRATDVVLNALRILQDQGSISAAVRQAANEVLSRLNLGKVQVVVQVFHSDDRGDSNRFSFARKTGDKVVIRVSARTLAVIANSIRGRLGRDNISEEQALALAIRHVLVKQIAQSVAGLSSESLAPVGFADDYLGDGVLPAASLDVLLNRLATISDGFVKGEPAKSSVQPVPNSAPPAKPAAPPSAPSAGKVSVENPPVSAVAAAASAVSPSGSEAPVPTAQDREAKGARRSKQRGARRSEETDEKHMDRAVERVIGESIQGLVEAIVEALGVRDALKADRLRLRRALYLALKIRGKSVKEAVSQALEGFFAGDKAAVSRVLGQSAVAESLHGIGDFNIDEGISRQANVRWAYLDAQINSRTQPSNYPETPAPAALGTTSVAGHDGAAATQVPVAAALNAGPGSVASVPAPAQQPAPSSAQPAAAAAVAPSKPAVWEEVTAAVQAMAGQDNQRLLVVVAAIARKPGEAIDKVLEGASRLLKEELKLENIPTGLITSDVVDLALRWQADIERAIESEIAFNRAQEEARGRAFGVLRNNVNELAAQIIRESSLREKVTRPYSRLEVTVNRGLKDLVDLLYASETNRDELFSIFLAKSISRLALPPDFIARHAKLIGQFDGMKVAEVASLFSDRNTVKRETIENISRIHASLQQIFLWMSQTYKGNDQTGSPVLARTPALKKLIDLIRSTHRQKVPITVADLIRANAAILDLSSDFTAPRAGQGIGVMEFPDLPINDTLIAVLSAFDGAGTTLGDVKIEQRPVMGAVAFLAGRSAVKAPGQSSFPALTTPRTLSFVRSIFNRLGLSFLSDRFIRLYLSGVPEFFRPYEDKQQFEDEHFRNFGSYAGLDETHREAVRDGIRRIERASYIGLFVGFFVGAALAAALVLSAGLDAQSFAVVGAWFGSMVFGFVAGNLGEHTRLNLQLENAAARKSETVGGDVQGTAASAWETLGARPARGAAFVSLAAVGVAGLLAFAASATGLVAPGYFILAAVVMGIISVLSFLVDGIETVAEAVAKKVNVSPYLLIGLFHLTVGIAGIVAVKMGAAVGGLFVAGALIMGLMSFVPFLLDWIDADDARPAVELLPDARDAVANTTAYLKSFNEPVKAISQGMEKTEGEWAAATNGLDASMRILRFKKRIDAFKVPVMKAMGKLGRDLAEALYENSPEPASAAEAEGLSKVLTDLIESARAEADAVAEYTLPYNAGNTNASIDSARAKLSAMVMARLLTAGERTSEGKTRSILSWFEAALGAEDEAVVAARRIVAKAQSKATSANASAPVAAAPAAPAKSESPAPGASANVAVERLVLADTPAETLSPPSSMDQQEQLTEALKALDMPRYRANVDPTMPKNFGIDFYVRFISALGKPDADPNILVVVREVLDSFPLSRDQKIAILDGMRQVHNFPDNLSESQEQVAAYRAAAQFLLDEAMAAIPASVPVAGNEPTGTERSAQKQSAHFLVRWGAVALAWIKGVGARRAETASADQTAVEAPSEAMAFSNNLTVLEKTIADALVGSVFAPAALAAKLSALLLELLGRSDAAADASEPSGAASEASRFAVRLRSSASKLWLLIARLKGEGPERRFFDNSLVNRALLKAIAPILNAGDPAIDFFLKAIGVTASSDRDLVEMAQRSVEEVAPLLGQVPDKIDLQILDGDVPAEELIVAGRADGRLRVRITRAALDKVAGNIARASGLAMSLGESRRLALHTVLAHEIAEGLFYIPHDQLMEAGLAGNTDLNAVRPPVTLDAIVSTVKALVKLKMAYATGTAAQIAAKASETATGRRRAEETALIISLGTVQPILKQMFDAVAGRGQVFLRTGNENVSIEFDAEGRPTLESFLKLLRLPKAIQQLLALSSAKTPYVGDMETARAPGVDLKDASNFEMFDVSAVEQLVRSAGRLLSSPASSRGKKAFATFGTEADLVAGLKEYIDYLERLKRQTGKDVRFPDDGASATARERAQALLDVIEGRRVDLRLVTVFLNETEAALFKQNLTVSNELIASIQKRAMTGMGARTLGRSVIFTSRQLTMADQINAVLVTVMTLYQPLGDQIKAATVVAIQA